MSARERNARPVPASAIVSATSCANGTATQHLLIDEKAGRHAAKRMGVSVLGVLGLLLDAKSSGLVTSVSPHVGALRAQAGFYLTDRVIQATLREAGEAE